MSTHSRLIGVIADTHNLLRPEARAALLGVDHILHAGDICGPALLEQLAEIAPLTAVRGNNDRGAWAESLRPSETVELGGVRILLLHDLQELHAHGGPGGAQVVVSGHSHRPAIRMEGGVLYFNPGSAGPRRFSLPISLGYLEIAHGQCKPRLRTLEIG